ncbi:precorrin-6A/cobalt-precorrin-6A reductase, partial [Streptomyces lasiicapitis]|uniref:precorrin-6A/cobalt-precorrin-6A reductase n=1 Tax=Streptomyces lasiicapitis TaxID=1923961 RepID=UPI0036D0AF8B
MPHPPHVLVLGGTTEARRLAAALAARPGVRVTTSLAGRVSRPAALDGDVRVGGFGGPDGLADWLRENRGSRPVVAPPPGAGLCSALAGPGARG